MKKLIAVLLVVLVMATMLTACGTFTCGLCGREKSGKRYEREVFGQELDICKDCYQSIQDLANAFN